ncbi:Hypothetical predicted protein [Marmota monax]|uniref:Uncharacterized protein n=1 Tax=Marmota monax TaxID=9995 RepID=A0A5E4B320_MARMO|nr:Hypothetical predicted protein [Marmota monax]
MPFTWPGRGHFAKRDRAAQHEGRAWRRFSSLLTWRPAEDRAAWPGRRRREVSLASEDSLTGHSLAGGSFWSL